MAKFLKKAEAQAEGNVRAYNEKQQAALSALQVRARRDRQTLMRMLAHIQVSHCCCTHSTKLLPCFCWRAEGTGLSIYHMVLRFTFFFYSLLNEWIKRIFLWFCVYIPIQKASSDSHEDDPLETFEMDGATGNIGRTSGFTFKDEGRKDDLLEEEAEGGTDMTDLALPPLVSAQSRTSQPMSVNPVQSLTVSTL